jgi:hypothetical protein
VVWAIGCGDNHENAVLPDAPPDMPMSPDGPSHTCDAAWHDVQLGTELDDTLSGLAFDADGNLYVAGFEHGVTGVDNIDPSGDARGVVIRVDPTGAVQWKAVLDTSGADTVESVALDAASHTVFAVGRTSGAFDGFTNQGQFDLFLAAIDSDGRPTSVFQSGDERPQHPTRLSLGPDHQLAVAGYDDTFIQNRAVEAQEDGFFGNFVRSASAPSGFTQAFLQKVPIAGPNRMTDVAIDRDGGGSMYVTSSVGDRRFGPGIFAKKFNRDGSLAWSTPISPITADAANAVGLSPANELFVTGATFRTLGKQSFGQQDAYVLKLDRMTGSVIWAAQAGTANSDYPTSLAFDDAGNVYSAGYTFVPDPVDPSKGRFQPFVMKFDATGSLTATWRAGDDADAFITAMAIDSCNHVVIGGYTRGTMGDGAHNAGGFDLFVMRPPL